MSISADQVRTGNAAAVAVTGAELALTSAVTSTGLTRVRSPVEPVPPMGSGLVGVMTTASRYSPSGTRTVQAMSTPVFSLTEMPTLASRTPTQSRVCSASFGASCTTRDEPSASLSVGAQNM